MTQFCRVVKKDRVLLVTINRPDRLNALHLQKNFVHDEVFRQGSNPGMPTHATFLIDQRSSPSCERSPTASPHRSPWPACARSTWA